MQQTALLIKGRDLVEVSSATLLNYHWLLKFSRGQVLNPSVNRVQKLYEYLSGSELSI